MTAVEPGAAPDDAAAARDYARLIASLVHDLRNPLAALSGNLALLREELVGVEAPAAAWACLSDAEVLIARALGMVGTIADADALGRGEILARPAPVAVAAEVDRAVALIDAEREARRLRVEVAIDDELTAAIDRRLFARVLQALLENAVRFAPRGGRIAVRAQRDGGEVVVAVGNDGPALTAGERARLFSAEFRAAERLTAARRGRGLGMYFCRLVAEAHGGSIAVRSYPDLPVEFELRLPDA